MRLNGFDLNQLICLQALLRERSVSKVAAQVHLGQSSVSWILAQLRAHFGDQLLVRAGRQFVLTPFAETLVEPVGELLAQAQALTARGPGDDPAQSARRFRIVASDYLMAAGLSRVIQAAAAAMPRLRFDLMPLTAVGSAALLRGDVDLLCAGQALEMGLPPNRLLFEDHFVCLACAEHGPAPDMFDKTEYLRRQHIVLRYFEQHLTFEDEEALRREGVDRRQRMAVWSHALIPDLLVGSEMVATVAGRVATELTRHWPLRQLPFPFKQTPMRVYAYWHASRNDDPVTSKFVDMFIENF